jgi:hypothetical protein
MKYRIDPELQYCPQCQDEYRAGIIECASCEVELISGSKMLNAQELKEQRMAGRTMEISIDDELVDLSKGPVLTVKQMQAKLAAQGFPSIIAGDSDSCGKGCCGSEVRLQIRMTDVEDIMGFMAREHIQTTGLGDHDTSYVDAVYDSTAMNTTCPACGCSFSPQNKICPDCGLCF